MTQRQGKAAKDTRNPVQSILEAAQYPAKRGPPREKRPHPDFDAHAWNETEILAHMGTGIIRMAVNGVEVTRYKDEDPTRLRKGPIGLQIHAGASEVEYKDLEIEVDPRDDRLLTVK